MIPATQPYEARYKQERTDSTGKVHTYFDLKPVIAWDDDGYPLVVDGKALTRADRWSNYVNVVPADSPVVGVIPGGGWMAEWKDEDGSLWPAPIVAWSIRADGDMTPLSGDATGLCSDPTGDENFVRIYHPNNEQAPAGRLADYGPADPSCKDCQGSGIAKYADGTPIGWCLCITRGA